jgi:predicted DCC family thiol-disulfide oxidoreductase YuxK
MKTTWRIKLLYDGNRPLCSREIRFLERRDRGRMRIQSEDIADPSFDPGVWGPDDHRVVARILGVLPNGAVIEGVEVFRQAARLCAWAG